MSIPLLKRILILSQIQNPNFNFPFSFSPSFFSSSSSPSPSPSISTIVSVLVHHRSSSRWRYLNSLCPDGFHPNDFSQIILHIKNNPHLALRFFLWTQNKSLCLHDLLSYSTIIHILARGRLKTQAKSVIQTAIRASNVENDDSEFELFKTLVKTYRQCGSAPFVFDLLIKALLDSKKIDPSIHIVRLLRSRGINPQVGTLNSLILWVSRGKGANAGYDIFREVFGLDCDVEGKNVKFNAQVCPNVHTFNMLMMCFYQDGLVSKVKEVWDQLIESNSVPNSYSYSILMAVFCDEKRMVEAEELCKEMRMKNLELDVVAYNTIIGGFCKAGNIERAEVFYREMELRGIESTSATFEHLIDGYCKIGDVDNAILVYKDMRRKHFWLNSSTLEAIIRGLSAESRILEASDVLRFATGDSNFSPTMETYEILINGFCQEGNIDAAFKLQAEMVGKGFKPNLKIYSYFVDGYRKEGNEVMVEKLRKEVLESQLS